MKPFVVGGVLQFACILGIVTATSSQEQPKSEKFNSIECRKITVRNSPEDPAISIQAMTGFAGIWVSSPDGTPCVAIYFDGSSNTAVVGAYGPDKRPSAMQWAISTDKEGPYLQTVDNAGTRTEKTTVKRLSGEPIRVNANPVKANSVTIPFRIDPPQKE